MSLWDSVIVAVVYCISLLFGIGLYNILSSRYSVFKKLEKNLFISIVITLVLLLIISSPILFNLVPSSENIHIFATMCFFLGFLPRLSLLQWLKEAHEKQKRGFH